jgi:lipoprotein-anchoring transpeptidase ErfK/SrfK
MGTTTTWDHGPVQLMVLRAHQQAGNLWLLVRRPQRPNDSRGWINANRAEIHRIRWRISVSRAHRRLRVFRGGHLIRAFRTVVGKPSTPTPAGLFAIYERAREVPSDGFEGPWSLHLTAHSNRLHSFDGGSGLIAIHGRDGASLSDPLGTARSHGCIRISNHPVRWLASHVPLGTPVRVR